MITDFIKKNDISEELIKEYEDKLPSEMIAFWKEFGFGTFYDGYLKAINPDDYKDLIEKSYFQGDVSIPIFATAFGDLITWEKNQFVGIVKYRYGENDECFGYVPLLALGGKESVNNLKKVKILEHIALITEMSGEV